MTIPAWEPYTDTAGWPLATVVGDALTDETDESMHRLCMRLNVLNSAAPYLSAADRASVAAHNAAIPARRQRRGHPLLDAGRWTLDATVDYWANP